MIDLHVNFFKTSARHYASCCPVLGHSVQYTFNQLVQAADSVLYVLMLERASFSLPCIWQWGLHKPISRRAFPSLPELSRAESIFPSDAQAGRPARVYCPPVSIWISGGPFAMGYYLTHASDSLQELGSSV